MMDCLKGEPAPERSLIECSCIFPTCLLIQGWKDGEFLKTAVYSEYHTEVHDRESERNKKKERDNDSESQEETEEKCHFLTLNVSDYLNYSSPLIVL